MKLINRPDIKQRILWFSDIHFLEDDVDEYLQIFLDEFFKIVKEIDSIQKIDYVIISGDLTNKGTEIEFEKFTKYILNPLFEILKNSRLLVIPGNHDITIERSFDYEKILNIARTERDDFFLKDNDYRLFFNNYTKFCNDNINYFPRNIFEPYKRHFLYGFHKDEESKIMFVLLNSTWLSLSVKLLEHILEKEYITPVDLRYKDIYIEIENIKNMFDCRKNDLDIDDLKKFENNISNLKIFVERAKEEQANAKSKLTGNAYNISYQTIEYGIQELFLNFLFENINKLQSFLDEHNSYFIITVMHHPENHLTWNERIEPNSIFSCLKANSDILLSSHEHIPKDYKHSHSINKVLHLKSGPFIELGFNPCPASKNKFDYFSESKLNLSSFSILDINVSNKKVKEIKYTYDGMHRKWGEYKNDENQVFDLGKKRINLSHSDIQNLYSKIKSASKIDLIKKITNYDIEEVANVSNLYSLNDELFIINNSSKFEVINDEILTRVIIGKNIKKVFFYSFDIMIDHPEREDFDLSKLTQFYIKENEDQDIALGKLKKKMFKNFNDYRSCFFNRFESPELEALSDVSFVFILLPYWEIKRVL